MVVRQGYVFYVNPLGIQTDGYWIEGMTRRRGSSGVSIDYNPDFIWDSDGRVTEEGWTAELRIPYVSLRLPPVAVTPRIRITNKVSLNGRVYYRELPIYAEANRGLEFLADLCPYLAKGGQLGVLHGPGLPERSSTWDTAGPWKGIIPTASRTRQSLPTGFL